MTERTPADLIAEILKLDDYLDQQSKRFNDFLKPHREQLEALKMQLQDYLNKSQGKSFRCDAGTAYLSTIVTPSIDGDKTNFLDWVLEDWESRGAMLQIGAPQKAALEEYRDAHDGALPPTVKTSSFTRVNVRRS